MQHCFFCGEQLGVFDAAGERYLTCGARLCEREARFGEDADARERATGEEPYCPFCRTRHEGGDTCMGHHP
jgi:hypothetical protein